MDKSLVCCLSKIVDFRNTENKNFRHPLLDILLLSICAVFSGAEDFEEIALFGLERVYCFDGNTTSNYRKNQAIIFWHSKGITPIISRSPGIFCSSFFYICSLQNLDTKQAFDLARGHWASGNKLHWQLDVTFQEDKQRHRTKNAPENLALIRKIVLNAIQIKEKNLSKKSS